MASGFSDSPQYHRPREVDGSSFATGHDWRAEAGARLSMPNECRCLCTPGAGSVARDAVRYTDAGAAILSGGAIGGAAGMQLEARQLPSAPGRERPTNLTGGLPDYVINNLKDMNKELDRKGVAQNKRFVDGKDDRKPGISSTSDEISGKRWTESRVASTPEGVVATSRNFDPNKNVNLVVYMHGNFDDHNGWSRRANLQTAIKSMPDNTVVIVPPTNVSAAGLDQAIKKLGVGRENIGHVSFMGHSAGGAALGRLLMQTDAPQYRHLSPQAVTAMSTLYGPSPALEQWARRHKGDTNRTLHVVYEPGRTQTWAHDLSTRLKAQTHAAGMQIDYRHTPAQHMQQPAYYLTHLQDYR